MCTYINLYFPCASSNDENKLRNGEFGLAIDFIYVFYCGIKFYCFTRDSIGCYYMLAYIQILFRNRIENRLIRILCILDRNTLFLLVVF